MQFEEFDKKIKEASDHYHPAYDETAWKKMNHLLDEQLPEKKDDWRRIYYLLFLLIFGTAVGYLLIEKPWNPNNKMYASKNNIRTKSIPATNQVISKKDITTGNNSTGKKYDQGRGSESISTKKSNLNHLTNTIPGGKVIIPFNKKYRKLSQGYKNPIKVSTGNKNSYRINKDRRPEAGTGGKNEMEPRKQGDIIAGNTLLPRTTIISDSANEVKQPTIEPVSGDPLAKSKNKKEKSFVNKLGFSISAGPDKSAIFSSSPGKTTLYYGAGFRYDISKRITVKTGFYITNKIYTAAGKDYKQSYNYYPTFTLTSVNADCKIFEIPIVVNYNFIQHNKNNLFGSIGTSSLIMKRESYQYHYNNLWGQYRYGAYTYDNKNKHYFSVVTLSAGYERKLNPIFSVIAEPYVKLPLYGIGAGKIKLNSAGLLVSVGVKPFAAKEKKK